MNLLPGLLTVAGGPLLRAIRGSLSIRVINKPVARKYLVSGRSIGIGAFWHRHLIPIASFTCRLNAVVMISRSRDGELIARAIERTPLSAVRGSSSCGGPEALQQMIESVKAGRPGAFTCDGPKGPSRKAKIGVVIAARSTGAPIVPIACAVRPSIELGSWDRTVVPLPGARAVFAFGEPIPVGPDDDCERVRAELETLLCRMEDRCETSLNPVV